MTNLTARHCLLLEGALSPQEKELLLGLLHDVGGVDSLKNLKLENCSALLMPFPLFLLLFMKDMIICLACKVQVEFSHLQIRFVH